MTEAEERAEAQRHDAWACAWSLSAIGLSVALQLTNRASLETFALLLMLVGWLAFGSYLFAALWGRRDGAGALAARVVFALAVGGLGFLLTLTTVPVP